MDEWKRSGQIPTFGDWENAIDLPITQYFESARQAGLINRYSSSSGESDPNCHHRPAAADFRKHSRNLAPPRKTMRGSHLKEQRKQGSKQQGKVCDFTEQPRKQKKDGDDYVIRGTEINGEFVPRHVKNPKPVDEDLYKIPSELIYSTKRKKKVTGLFSCLVLSCAS